MSPAARSPSGGRRGEGRPRRGAGSPPPGAAFLASGGGGPGGRGEETAQGDAWWLVVARWAGLLGFATLLGAGLVALSLRRVRADSGHPGEGSALAGAALI